MKVDLSQFKQFSISKRVFALKNNVLCIVLLLFTIACSTTEKSEYRWQEAQATVTETGAIFWKPKPFMDDLRKQDDRYIDYEEGDDSNDGLNFCI